MLVRAVKTEVSHEFETLLFLSLACNHFDFIYSIYCKVL